jgi:hypothetical protein
VIEEAKRPEYSREQAAKLICACYNLNGADVKSDLLKKSILEDSLGELPDTWNVGLFRFLDEAIYLYKCIGFFTLARGLRDKSERSITILTYQIEKSLLAVRVLSAAGLDASARQNLRAMFEMCEVICRCVVDVEFSKSFSEAQTTETANKFWHEFISKGKTKKFLQKYNDENEDKCGLVMGEVLGDAFKVLGLGAHPNFLGWSLDFQKDLQAIFSYPDETSMFQFSPKMASELVLAISSQIAFVTLTFLVKRVAKDCPTLGLLSKNPMFKHCKSDKEAIEAVGENSALMFLMLCKLVNRGNPDFDPKVHF